MSQTSLWGGSLTVKPNGKLLVELRKREPGRLQRDVELAIDIPLLRLSSYERGNSCSIYHLKKLAAYYNVPPQDLIEPESLNITQKLAYELNALCGISVVEAT